MVGVIYVYVDTVFGFVLFRFGFFKLRSWMFQHACFECLVIKLYACVLDVSACLF